MPFLLSRFQYQEKTMKDRAARLPNGLLHELQRFYYDTAQANHPGALAALLKLVTPEHCCSARISLPGWGGEVIAGLNAHAFSDKELAFIARNNAMRFMPGLSSDCRAPLQSIETRIIAIVGDPFAARFYRQGSSSIMDRISVSVRALAQSRKDTPVARPRLE